MSSLLDKIIENEKTESREIINYLLDVPHDSIDSALHIAHAIKSGLCFPYFPAMLLNKKGVIFKLDEDDLTNYPNEDFGKDIEQCSSLQYLTEDPCLYINNGPKIAIQNPEIEKSTFKRRIQEFSSINSYELGCIVDIKLYKSQTEDLSLPNPSKCKGSEIMGSWLYKSDILKWPFILEKKHCERFKSHFNNVPGMKIYYPDYSFCHFEKTDEKEIKDFKKYFSEKVEPKLKEILDR
ncbi:hypothetical protein JW949_00150 [Candidatus Woesearchaeota archaeon]|nr:hypothetical protein [Candidatus Woesearchaeota archaeon]